MWSFFPGPPPFLHRVLSPQARGSSDSPSLPLPSPPCLRSAGKRQQGMPVEGEWDSSRLARVMLENTFGAEFFVPKD